MLREHVGPLLFALSALTSLLLLNYIAKQIGQLAGKGLSAAVIGKFFLLSIPFTVAMTMPMSILVATLYAFSRLAAENEVTALKSNGVSLARLLVPVILSAATVSVGMIAFNDLVLPAANHRLRTLQGDIARKKPTFGLREQIINQIADRQVYLKAMRVTQDNRLFDITIYDLTDVMQRRTIYADSGDLAFATNGNDLVLTLHHGSTLTVPRAEPMRLERLRFDRDYLRVEDVANSLEMTQVDSYKSDREMSVCELQNEVSRYEIEYDRGRRELASTLRSAVTEALTGQPAVVSLSESDVMLNMSPGAAAPRSEHASLGRAYCDFRNWIGRRVRRLDLALVPSLHAATVSQQGNPPPPTPPVVLPPATGGVGSAVPQTQDSLRLAQDSTLTAVAAPVVRQQPVILGTVIDNARNRLRDNTRFVNQSAVELHKKFAISVACTVFILVGAPIALRFPRGGVGLVIGVSLVIFGIYYVGLIAGEELANWNMLSPFWAMWAANMLLTVVGLTMLARIGRETATSRGGDFREIMEIFASMFHRRSRVPEAAAGRSVATSSLTPEESARTPEESR